MPQALWLSLEVDVATRVQILDQAICILHCPYTLGKGMNPIILSPYLPTPPLGQDMTQGQFLSGV